MKPLYKDFFNKPYTADLIEPQLAARDTRCGHCHRESLVPLSRFGKAELAEAIAESERFIELLTTRHANIPTPSPTSEAPRFHYKSINYLLFRHFWQGGIPIIIYDLPTTNINPQYFMKNFGDIKVLMEDCEANEPSKKIGLRDFITNFGRSHSASAVWKVKDLPPNATFSDTFRDLWMTFMDILPLPDISRFNGPKAYVAQGTFQDDAHSGSTVLHMDLTSAVNINTWGVHHATGLQGFALWHIFPPSSASTLRRFLTEKTAYKGLGDIIHSQTVWHYAIYNQAISRGRNIHSRWVPSSSTLHTLNLKFVDGADTKQVSNACDAIKIALDFVDVDSLDRTVQLAREFRQHRLATGQGDDVLQVKTLLWHAWNSLCEQADKLKVDGSTRTSRARRKRKQKDRDTSSGIRKKNVNGVQCACPVCSQVISRSNLIHHV
ncbi:hypothetical protein HWV62_4930 [Athelia sp. TMB]|nr:hypothetical protein HWV62_4930 [Athelia sp. TMB]